MKIKFCCSVNHIELGDFAMVGYQFGAPMYKSERPYEGKEFQTQLFVLLSGRWIPGKGKDVFIHYGMRDYDFNTFDGWFIGPIGDYILGITTPGKLFWEKPTVFINYRYSPIISRDESNNGWAGWRNCWILASVRHKLQAVKRWSQDQNKN